MAKEKKEIRLSADFDNTYDEILLDQQVNKKKDGITDIPIEKLHTFINHPFKVQDDEKMDELVESIRENGILSPVVVRPLDDGYELISGHRRTHAAKRAGLISVPAVIRDLSDDEATVLMVDANIQREEILPSERAHSLKMKIDAINRLYRHGDRKCVRSRDIAGNEAGLSGRQVQRYLNLNDLNQGFLDMVDEKRIQMNLGLEIASMRPEVQKWLFDSVEMGSVINSDIIKHLKEVDETEGLDEDVINYILNEQEQKPKGRKIILSERKLNKYFSDIYEIEEIETILYSLLDRWKRTMEGENSDE